MVTHDRYFLERVVNRITELSRGKLYHYEANYSKYLELKAQRAEMAEASAAQAAVHPPGGAGVDHAGLPGPDHQEPRTASQRYEALKNQDGPGDGRGCADGGGAPAAWVRRLIELHGVCQGLRGPHGSSVDFSYNLLRDDRIGIVGRNGAGKVHPAAPACRGSCPRTAARWTWAPL